MTVRQLVQKFGEQNDKGEIDWSNFSPEIKSLWDAGEREVWIEVRHIIMPNDDYNKKALHAKHKKYLSVYYETGKSQGRAGYPADKYLRESGYDWFPVL
jgi:hypothetical protein